MTPRFLDDDTFTSYGGQINNAPTILVQNAYEIAEMLVEEYLGTPLSVQTIVDFLEYNPAIDVYRLSKTMVKGLDHVYFYYATGSYLDGEDLANIFVLSNADQGILHNICPANGKYWGVNMAVVYEAGFDTGTFGANPQALWGLTMTAQLVLNELYEPGVHEGPVGIESYSNMRYAERRVKLYNTLFGTSSTANFVKKMLAPLKRSRVGRL